MAIVTPEKADPVEIVQRVHDESLIRLGIEDSKVWKKIASPLMMLALPRFGQVMAELDKQVAAHGFRAGVQWLLPLLQMRTTSANNCNVPTDGPVLLVANHPGGADFCAVFAELPRDDAILVAAVEELKLLPNLQQNIVYSSRTKGKKKQRGETTRKLIEELQGGRCVLLYPRGKMEPDPRWANGARDCLPLWSNSVERFARAVPALTVVPVCISGSVSRKALSMRWLNLFKSERYKQRIAVFVQLAMSMIRPKQWDVTPHVQFGTPIRVANHKPHEILPLAQREVDRMLTHARAADWPLRARTVGWTT